jgi:hypothetical protein
VKFTALAVWRDEHYLDWSGFGHAPRSWCSPEFRPLNNKLGRWTSIAAAAGDSSAWRVVPRGMGGHANRQYLWYSASDTTLRQGCNFLRLRERTRMKKLRLSLEALRVQSFPTQRAGRQHIGTVRGYDSVAEPQTMLAGCTWACPATDAMSCATCYSPCGGPPQSMISCVGGCDNNN